MDSAGNLYGTTMSGGDGYGTVFELVKSCWVWGTNLVQLWVLHR